MAATSLPTMSIIQGIGIGIATMILNEIPWSSVFLITQLFGIRLYILKRKEICEQIQKKIGTLSSHITDESKAYGYSVGFWYILHITIETSYDRESSYTVWMICTESTYKYLIKEKEKSITLAVSQKTEVPVKSSSIRIFQRYGSFQNPYFSKRQIHISIEPWEEQLAVLTKIEEYYNSHKHCVVYLHGPPGTGKSMIPILFAGRVKGGFCNTLKPWQPGDTLSGLYTDASPTEESPLIVTFDEADSFLEKIHKGIPPHKSLPISTGDKAGWNHMLDEIQRGLYPHLVVVMTSNKSPDYINSLDTSYLRKGRVDLFFELNQNRDTC